ncbi:MAG: putative ubiquitin-activating enzyme 5 [Streblomastix strix]|uniref:Ubiquitin-like modifier-activating enzyme 5 n=1 Tax=Streblomastix strix TaxID=222440 RepID=A0A5J4UTE7_9EUKA|nr:MAG: putative ubiquitin-activating enzyme 5 [Streblomastix strix]
MDATVNDDNPYSRLMALQKMGIVKNYEEIRTKTVAVVGVGGIGSVTSEMLTRCGIGKLVIFDYDTVEKANMNRLFFTPDQVKMTKTDAAAQTLRKINPDVIISPYCFDITTTKNYETFKKILANEGLQSKDEPSKQHPIDLLLCGVDNFNARIAINRACLELDLPWFESGVSETAISGHIQFIQPGTTPCFECLPPLLVSDGIDESSIKREGVCAASLPTTMGIIAGLLVQNALKFLLRFGKVVNYLGYNALSDFFPNTELKANENCRNEICRQMQKRFQDYVAEQKLIKKDEPEQKIEKSSQIPINNPFDIEITDESDNNDDADTNIGVEGLKLHFKMQTAPIQDKSNVDERINQSKDKDINVNDKESDTDQLAKLMKDLKALNTSKK